MEDTKIGLADNHVLMDNSTKSLLTLFKNDLADDLPPAYEVGSVNFVSPVLEKLLDKMKQKVFLRKVLMIIVVQHMFILSLVFLGTFYTPMELIIWVHYLVWVSLVLMFITSFVTVCCSTSLLRKLPVNIIMLILLTLTTGFLLASMAIASRTHTTLWTIGTTTINIVVLIIFTFQSKWELTTWTAMCLSLIVVQSFNVARVYICNEAPLALCLSGPVIMLYFFAIIYDLRLIVDKKHEIDTSFEEYSFAALNIHVDILIMYLLRRCCFEYLTKEKTHAVQITIEQYKKLTLPYLEANMNKS